MSVVHASPTRAYTNVMELLVAEEVDKQFSQLPPRVMKYVKRLEVETYALNRLPSLYASSEKGWQYQYDKAKREFDQQVSHAVRQAFAAVQVDPIRLSKPLPLSEGAESQIALQALREMLHQPDLSWEAALRELGQALNADESGKPTPQPSREHDSRTVFRPGTYGREMSWKADPNKASSPDYGWDDVRYRR
ncbi:MAG: late competence development ComFB family protein [Leptolyngbyaceae cyanobacterium MO_188.B28]|nr:late competence development ComFB family protein [Leptolyngbyaceae cyanobacterium MO_188.B28]